MYFAPITLSLFISSGLALVLPYTDDSSSLSASSSSSSAYQIIVYSESDYSELGRVCLGEKSNYMIISKTLEAANFVNKGEQTVAWSPNNGYVSSQDDAHPIFFNSNRPNLGIVAYTKEEYYSSQSSSESSSTSVSSNGDFSQSFSKSSEFIQYYKFETASQTDSTLQGYQGQHQEQFYACRNTKKNSGLYRLCPQSYINFLIQYDDVCFAVILKKTTNSSSYEYSAASSQSSSLLSENFNGHAHTSAESSESSSESEIASHQHSKQHGSPDISGWPHPSDHNPSGFDDSHGNDNTQDGSCQYPDCDPQQPY